MVTQEIVYFDRPGKRNTDGVIRAVRKRVEDLSIGQVVVATNTGETALKVWEALQGTGAEVIAVGEHYGFWGGDSQKLLPEKRQELEERGIAVFFGAHALSGVGRSVTNKFGGISHVEIIAYTLRQFGSEGLKVAVEVAVMAMFRLRRRREFSPK